MTFGPEVLRRTGSCSNARHLPGGGVHAGYFGAVLVSAAFLLSADAVSATYIANPNTYRQVIQRLKPGDILELLPGEYDGLPIRDLHGRAGAPITLKGHSEQTAIVGNSARNTVSIRNASHLVIRDFRLDGRGVAANGVVCERESRFAHHITIENLTITNFMRDQSGVGISARCPAWGWVIRGNRIVGHGTGMYLGNSDGTGPFFAATIEDNVILDPIGYGIQIKHQVERPEFDGMPVAPSVTVIRRNRIIKSDGASTGKDARPNLLVGHFPRTGTGSQDMYLIHSNVLYDNPSESLFQGEGNIALYNNLLINPRGDAVRIQPHNDRPRTVHVFNNTVIAAGVGISVRGGEPGFERQIAGNVVFASRLFATDAEGRNLSASLDLAIRYVVRPEGALSGLDLTPRGSALDSDESVPDTLLRFPGAHDDFRGMPRNRPVFGACVGPPTNNADLPPCR